MFEKASSDTMKLFTHVAASKAYAGKFGLQKMWHFSSLFAYGKGTRAIDEIKQCWGFMISQGATTTWESLDMNADPHHNIHNVVRSYCHGWSACPAWLLPRYVLGIYPVQPGFTETMVEPRMCGIAWAQGSIPTPYGPIDIRVEQGSVADMRVPDGIRIIS